MSSVTAVPIAQIKRGYLVWLWVGIAAALVLAAALAFAAPIDGAEAFLAGNRRKANVMQTSSGLQYKVLAPGKGTPPSDADVALVMYDGMLVNGTRFDRSVQPFVAPLGEKATVPGFEEALKLMPRGAKYRVWIKPSLGYGKDEKRDASGQVVIPANSILVFDLDMLDYKSKDELRRLQMQQQMMSKQGAPGASAVRDPAAPAGAPER